MGRIVAFIPDLLFGSNVLGALNAAGHETVLAGDGQALRAALPGADAVLVDLTLDPAVRLELLAAVLPAAGRRPRTLAFYSHVEGGVRKMAQSAGFDQVVPRSRMAREGPALIERLLSG